MFEDMTKQVNQNWTTDKIRRFADSLSHTGLLHERGPNLYELTTIQKIRQKIIEREYYLSSHAEEEMADDKLEREDIEHSVLQGKIEKKLTEDIRGTRYRIEGFSEDGRPIHLICRLKDDGCLVIITVYAL